MNISFKTISLSFALLISTAAQAVDRVENGVTITSGTGSPPTLTQSLAPEKRAADKKESFPVQPAPATTTTPAASDDTPDEDFTAEPEEKIRMKPVYDKSAKSKPTISSKDGPFKKSIYAGVNESVKKPDPKAEVSGHPLDDSMSDDIKNLDNIKKSKDKATNAEDGVGESGLPIPRFVSLKSGEANARAGAGDTYPIRWTYQRKNLPLEITAEFKLWRRIKDFDGEQSWVHQALLSSRRYGILLHDASAQSDYEDGHNVARFKRGVQVRLISCRSDACRVEYGDIQGWLKKKDLWGVYPKEVFE